ncbi:MULTISPECIES: hypothetical protein [unclassified Breznakia]|uniref:hypothetical protein n=1 Tax=unclassified Breznakia TaxID=2623764 RepID=UPI0024732542|nr:MULTISPECIES: hypothetical protein [unclassified Breznakia]MDH6367535.1 hypothetical protein [Breznakia sp. PH1-1]MDH6404671.1 hypothetical protein [Breznakia sp. PF1-11]MDH6412365.1 hypothetical protein [Breznakia sp. PFB1-11]MDH6414703.1 hypothetical protein [Breznakia sp. PFB1-14]MDH6417052.1 hypothetical protein [Breznakia sp. PFB1-4]
MRDFIEVSVIGENDVAKERTEILLNVNYITSLVRDDNVIMVAVPAVGLIRYELEKNSFVNLYNSLKGVNE